MENSQEKIEYLRLEKVALRAEKGRIIRDVNFSVKSGEILAIVSKNTFAMSQIVKAVKEKFYNDKFTPLIGRIIFYRIIQKGIGFGYMPQKKSPIRSFRLSAWQVALSGFTSCGKKGSFYLTRERVAARNVFDELGMSGFNKWNFDDLPYPEQIKVLFIRAYLAGNQILVLDNPFVCFERADELEKINRLIENRAEKGGSVIITGEDVLFPPSYASHVMYISDNDKQEFFGTREEYLESELYKKLSEEEKC